MEKVFKQARGPPVHAGTARVHDFETVLGLPNADHHKEDVMKKHDKSSVSQLTYKELKTIGSLRPSEDKTPRPLPAVCSGWPQQQ